MESIVYETGEFPFIDGFSYLGGGGGYKVAILIMKWVLHTWFELTEEQGNGNSVKLGPEKDGHQRRSCRFDFTFAGLYRDSGKIK